MTVSRVESFIFYDTRTNILSKCEPNHIIFGVVSDFTDRCEFTKTVNKHVQLTRVNISLTT